MKRYIVAAIMLGLAATFVGASFFPSQALAGKAEDQNLVPDQSPGKDEQ